VGYGKTILTNRSLFSAGIQTLVGCVNYFLTWWHTGGGCYGLPVVQRIFGWDGRIVLTKTLFELSQRLPVPGFVHLSDIKR
jgi:hypothetical protein